jgi:hypothetical protein
MRFIAFISLLIAAIAPVRAADPPQEESRAQEIISEVISRVPQKDSLIYGTLRIRRPAAEPFEVPLKYSVKRVENGWDGIYESQPASKGPAEVLIVHHKAGQRNEFFLGRNGDKPQLLPANGAPIPFAGSDFWVEDLGLDFLFWPTQTYIKHQMRKSRSCRVIESKHPTPNPKGYSRVLSWIDVETGGLIRAEGYDASNKLLKEFSIGGFKKVNGHWELKEMEIRNEQTESRTRLEFSFETDRIE